MSVSPRLREFLDRHGVTYQVLADAPPHATHTGRDAVRVVVIRHGGGLSLAVLPAHARIDLDRLGAALREEIVPASLNEIAKVFPECDPGAVPPLGILDGLKTYLDESLTHDRQIVFHAGARETVIRMSLEEYRRVAAPIVLWFAESPARRGMASG